MQSGPPPQINLLRHPEIKQFHGLMSRSVLLSLHYYGVTGAVSFSDLSALSSMGQSMWSRAAECLFTEEAGQWCAVWTNSKPIPTPVCQQQTTAPA